MVDVDSRMSGGDGGLPPTVPPPHWIANASCYTPMMLDNKRFLSQDAVTAADVAKAAVILLSTVLTVAFNLLFITVLNTR